MAQAATETDIDAAELLTRDHKEALALFKSYHSSSAMDKTRIVHKACKALDAHMTIEEEIFYPAFKLAFADHEMVPEGAVEHASARDLIALISSGAGRAGQEEFDARVKVLGELIEHQAGEEEKEMFPKARASPTLDLRALGRRMAQRKEELLSTSTA